MQMALNNTKIKINCILIYVFIYLVVLDFYGFRIYHTYRKLTKKKLLFLL